MGRYSRLAALAATVAACLAAAGCSAASQPAQRPASAAPGGTPTAPTSAGSAASTATAAPQTQAGLPADPFAGTPADHWGDGTAGIALPAAKPTGPFTKAQVEYAYQTTRTLLAAANLDKQTLLGGTPTAFANLMPTPFRAWFLAGLNKKGRDKQGSPNSTRAIVTSFWPGSAQLVGSAIKAHGTMYAQATSFDGSPELDMHVDYLFVYPIEPPHQPDRWRRVVVEDQWVVAFGPWQGAATAFAPWLDTYGGNVAGAACGFSDGYDHPAYASASSATAKPSASPSGKSVNPYVAGQPITGQCSSNTGT